MEPSHSYTLLIMQLDIHPTCSCKIQLVIHTPSKCFRQHHLVTGRATWSLQVLTFHMLSIIHANFVNFGAFKYYSLLFHNENWAAMGPKKILDVIKPKREAVRMTSELKKELLRRLTVSQSATSIYSNTYESVVQYWHSDLVAAKWSRILSWVSL